MLKLALHICCAPCALWPVEVLQNQGVDLLGVFFNPNIHPADEWERRRKEVLKLARKTAIAIDINPRYMEEFWREELDLPMPERCAYCYRMRLMYTAITAKKHDCDAFSTTLLVSPWQNRELILREADVVQEFLQIPFIPYDFRPGYRRGQARAKQLNMYRQKYCACIHSLNERKEESV